MKFALLWLLSVCSLLLSAGVLADTVNPNGYSVTCMLPGNGIQIYSNDHLYTYVMGGVGGTSYFWGFFSQANLDTNNKDVEIDGAVCVVRRNP